MKPHRALVFVFYAICTLLVLVPLLETIVSVSPLSPSQVAWRFGAAGLFSRALMTPLLGLTLLAVLGLLFNHRGTLLTVAGLCAFGALCLVVAQILFILDALQMRGQVRPDARTAFDMATLLAVLKIAVAFVVCVGLAIGGWKTARRNRPVREQPARVLNRMPLGERDPLPAQPVGSEQQL